MKLTTKFHLSVGAFGSAVSLTSMSVVELVQRGFNQEITTRFIAWLAFVAVFLVASIIALVYYRAKCQIGDEAMHEQMILEAERHKKQ